jgi:hypothetical protein
MRDLLARGCACLLFCSAALVVEAAAQVPRRAQEAAQPQQSSPADATLTNASVVKLVRAKFSDKTIIAIIRTRPARFDLSPDRLVELKRGGVSERVILAMLARENENFLAQSGAGEDDGFSSDPFFDDAGKSSPGAGRPQQSPGQSDPGEINIFGSSGGARGRSKTNGMGGGAEGESQTLGSVSARIIRPPTEAGATPKLERTPTLTNASVVELVEAGFSEGTIIRRIESSPADFDLSDAKLAELRRRRVTEPVIAAMRAAMSDDPGPKR